MENKTFKDYNLDERLVDALKNIGFESPTAIQELTLEHVLSGTDIFALAETGSGKTGSFAIPIINNILKNDMKGLYIVLSPTRELAQQTDKVFNQIGKDLGVKTSCIIGGESIDRQKEGLEEIPHVLVATPGRLIDILGHNIISITEVQGVVFDEADRLFDMGFKKDIERILKDIPDTRQLIMVSATTNMDVLSTAYKFRSHPVELKLNSDSLLVDNIDHKIAMIESNEKMPFLVNRLRKHEDAYAIIFCNTQYQTHLLAEWLSAMKFKAMPISGRLQQNKRTKLMEDFHAKKVTILVCTDVAARGLDIKDVNLVVNYDLPQDAANYVHRIGRTGRAGKDGEAISFCSFEDCEYLDGINELIGSNIPKMDIEDDAFAKDICKKPRIDSKTLRLVEKGAGQSQARQNQKKGKTFVDNKPSGITLSVDRPFTSSPLEAKNTKEFIVQTDDTSKVIQDALNYFQINDESLLEFEVIEKGRRKFFIFGKRTCTYRITLKAIYKKLLLPFLIDIIKVSKLKLRVKVSFKNNVYITFEGQDEKLLTRNDFELLKAFEYISKSFLINKINLPRSVKVFAKSFDSKSSDELLIKNAASARDKVLSTQKAVLMKPLNPAQRRLVHEYLSGDDKVKTNSIGDGKMKRIEVSPA